MSSQLLLPTELTYHQIELPDSPSQLHVEIRKAEFNFNEKIEIYFQLYNDTTKQFISEPFLTSIKEKGVLKSKKECVIRDIEKKDFESKLYLVGRIFRIGDFKKTEKPSQNHLKRPLGVCIYMISPFSLRSLIEGEPVVEKLICYTSKEELFSKLHQTIIDASQGSPNLQDIQSIDKLDIMKTPISMRLSLYERKYEELIEDFEDLKTIPFSNLYKFPDVVEPSCLRNDLYIYINNIYLSGLQTKLLKKSETQYRNLMMKFKVLLISEKPGNIKQNELILLKQVISSHVGDEEDRVQEYTSTSYYHVTNPTFNEIIKLNLIPQQLDKAILMINFYKISSKRNIPEPLPFAFTFSKFVTQNNFCQLNAPLTIYKYEKDIENKLESFIQDEDKKLKLSTKSYIDLKFSLISTKVTSIEFLKNLFKCKEKEFDWKNEIFLIQNIKNFFKVRIDSSVLTFLRELLDTFFLIIEKVEKQEIIDDVCKAIISLIVTIAHIPKFKDYKLVLQDYFDNNLFSLKAWDYFSLYVQKILSNYQNPTVELGDCFKSLAHVFHLMDASRVKHESSLSLKEEKIKNKKVFQDRILAIINTLNMIIKSDNTKLIQFQVIFFVYMGNLFDYVSQHFDSNESGELIKKFLHTVREKKSVDNLLTVIDSLTSGKLFKSETRNIYLPEIINDLKNIFDDLNGAIDYSADRLTSYHDKKKKIIKIISSILISYQELIQNNSNNEGIHKTFDYIFQLIPCIIDLSKKIAKEEQFEIKEIHNYNEEKALTKETNSEKSTKIKEVPVVLYEKTIKLCEKETKELLSIMIAYLNIIRLDLLKSNLQDPETTDKFLTNIFEMIQLLTSTKKIPIHWISFNLFTYNSIFNSLICIGNFLKENIQNEFFQPSLWKEFFKSCFKITKLKNLQIEDKFTRLKTRKILEKGDLRIKSLELSISMWEILNNQQIHFVPSLIYHILPLFNGFKNEKILSLVMNLYYGVLNCEFIMEGDFHLCEGETQKCLVTLDMSPDITILFISRLDKMFKDNQPNFACGKKLIKGLYELLTTISEVARYDDNEEDPKTDACIRVMNTFLKHNNFDLYYGYLYKLSEMHKTLNNYSEAANCLILYANRLKFTEDKILPFFADTYPSQTERERKEQLYIDIINLFDKDNDWEKAIKYSKELQQYYEDNFLYGNIKDVAIQIGEFYENIVSKNRKAKSYFHVEFYGKEEKGQFIYKEEKILISDFIDKLKRTRPNLEIIKGKVPDDIHEKSGTFARINTVVPALEYEVKGESLELIKNINPFVLDYYQNFNVFHFKKVRVYNTYEEKHRKKPKNEFQHLHRETIFYTIDKNSSLIRRKNPVVQIAEVTLNPLQNAEKDIEDKNKEIQEKLLSKKKNEVERVLSGTIDAAVLGGESHYIDAFFSNKFIKKSDEKSLESLKKLRDGLKKQIQILYEGLKVLKELKNSPEFVDYLEKKLKEKEKTLQPLFKHPLDPNLIELTEQEKKDEDLDESPESSIGSIRLNIIPKNQNDGFTILSPKSSFSAFSPRTSLADKYSPRGSFRSDENSKTNRPTFDLFSPRGNTSGSEEVITDIGSFDEKKGENLYEDLEFLNEEN